MTAERLPLEYVLPLRRTDAGGEAELLAYLRGLVEWTDVTVVDGSEPVLFDRLHDALDGSGVRHVPPSVPGSNGKARGAVTGMRAARHELVVLADDDVRYTRGDLEAVHARLGSADLVRVQNRYRPLPWHARWDTARILLNRAFGGDYGGTLGVRTSLIAGYRTDVLFENLELERTVRAAGGRVDVALDLLVVRRPPAVRHFLGQRVRQAYDDLAQPGRLVAEASLLPVVLVLALRRPRALLVLALGAVAVAEAGRRRAGGARRFPATSSLWAPAWAAERSVTTWLALAQRARGGIRYGDGRLRHAASSRRSLEGARS